MIDVWKLMHKCKWIVEFNLWKNSLFDTVVCQAMLKCMFLSGRGYYRCTHQKLYHCPAKKQVQRLDNDPFMFEVTYRGDHTCHLSSTAPSIPLPPPASLEMAHIATTQPILASAPVPLNRWLPVDFRMGGASGSRNMAVGGSGSGSGSGSEAGPSTSGTRRGKEVEYPLVADLADQMFNSGSSSTNSMDFIFPASMEDKRDGEDKKDWWAPGRPEAVIQMIIFLRENFE